ncbi:MAG: hypothetical protein M3O86_02025 [Actinomycetota bacterium]|nr:hypothetical protein [Actinomycetota bacterium]
MTYDPLAAVAALSGHGVRYVVIGGVAAVSQGSPIVTTDLDVCYDRSRDNLERLAAALRELHAHPRGAPDGLPLRLDADTLAAGDCFTFATDAGPLDVFGTLAGARGYDDLRSRAVAVDLGGFSVLAAAVDDLIAMKQASGRPKDATHVMHLEALRDELAAGD